MAEEPLVPRSATGIGMAAILLTAVMASLGFLGQKALDLDEQVIAVQEQQRDDEVINLMVHEIATKVTAIENRLVYRQKTVALVHQLDERLNRLEAHVEDLTKELDRLRDTK